MANPKDSPCYSEKNCSNCPPEERICLDELPRLYPEEYANGMILPDLTTQKQMIDYGKVCFQSGRKEQAGKDRVELKKQLQAQIRLHHEDDETIEANHKDDIAEAEKRGAEKYRLWIIKWGNTRCLNAQHGSAYFKGQCLKCWQAKLKSLEER